MSKSKPAAGAKGKGDKAEKTAAEKARGNRETVESIIIAVILAFLFRAFEAEAFVIPTGSMAPTLQGRHFDLKCEKCGQRYRTGASDERSLLVGATCPVCRYTMPVDPPIADTAGYYGGDPDECAMSGDRILVSKFAYELGEPRRWDIIVFKYPGNAKVNYIKRLVGLPGERVRIQYGNVYVKKQGERGYHIARKPADKVRAMLQLVDDTEHLPAELIAAGWPARWQVWSPEGKPAAEAWKTNEGGKSFAIEAGTKGESWLRYHHIVPSFEDWQAVEAGTPPADLSQRQGELITDFYAYNCNRNSKSYTEYRERALQSPHPFDKEIEGPPGDALGWHWVGDLAVECHLQVASDAGEALLDLVEGGVHYQCRLDVATGTASLTINGGFAGFEDEAGAATKSPTASTAVKGKGKYRLRLANVDDQLFLWVNDSPVKFDGPTTYGPPTVTEPQNVKPAWSPEDPGDIAPAGVGSKGAALSVSHLRILRDVYYIADNYRTNANWDYPNFARRGFDDPEVRQVLSDPATWPQTRLFDVRRHVEFPDDEDPNAYFGPNQFFPCGDNSPASKDGRLWSERLGPDGGVDPPPYVDRKLLLGKALFIYWPHTWNRPIPFVTPNFERMRLIH